MSSPDLQPYGYTWYAGGMIPRPRIPRPRENALYQQLADILRDQIRKGEWSAEVPLPTERELCKLHAVGLMTVRRAMTLLRDEGLVSTARGHRATVRIPPERTRIALSPHCRVIARMPDAAEREAMNLEPGIPLLEIRQPDGAVQVLPAHEVEVEFTDRAKPSR